MAFDRIKSILACVRRSSLGLRLSDWHTLFWLVPTAAVLAGAFAFVFLKTDQSDSFTTRKLPPPLDTLKSNPSDCDGIRDLVLEDQLKALLEAVNKQSAEISELRKALAERSPTMAPR